MKYRLSDLMRKDGEGIWDGKLRSSLPEILFLPNRLEVRKENNET
jgi:hypothetical protein